jgi:hypothetical protein
MLSEDLAAAGSIILLILAWLAVFAVLLLGRIRP